MLEVVSPFRNLQKLQEAPIYRGDGAERWSPGIDGTPLQHRQQAQLQRHSGKSHKGNGNKGSPIIIEVKYRVEKEPLA